MIFPFQGSLTSTSKGVISVFDRANNALMNLKKQNLDLLKKILQ
jgi:hypothetical protein